MTPAYYAAGTYKFVFTVRGNGFNSLPEDIVAVPSVSNDDPLQSRNATNPSVMMTVVNRTDTEITFEAAGEGAHNAAYLGAILSDNREMVYWLNETRPLP